MLKLLQRSKSPHLSSCQTEITFGLPKLRKKEKIIFDCVTNCGILYFEKWISSNNYLNFYKKKAKYQGSSYICSTALDITFYFYACVGVGIKVLHSGSDTDWAH